MKVPFPQERQSVQPESSAFVADPDLIRALMTRATPISCLSPRVLFNQDEPAVGAYILHQGSATLTMKAHNGKVIFSTPVVSGSLLGLPAVVSNHPYSLTASASAGAEISFVSRDDTLALMQANPLLSLKMLQVLAAEVRTAREALSR